MHLKFLLPSPQLPLPTLPPPMPSPPLLPLPTKPLPTLTLSNLPPPSLPPPPTLQIHELMLPPPLSIAITSPNPSEATEAKPNSRQMQEQAETPRVRNGDATPITKPEPVQIPSDNHSHPNIIESKPACSDSSKCNYSNHSCNLKDLGINNNRKSVYDPGSNNINVKDGSRHDDGDSTSTSSDSVSCTTAANTHHSPDHDHNKTIASPSDADAKSPHYQHYRSLHQCCLHLHSHHCHPCHHPCLCCHSRLEFRSSHWLFHPYPMPACRRPL